ITKKLSKTPSPLILLLKVSTRPVVGSIP
ncbi:unnamed protein product, partial [Oikopleura dioica]